MSSLITPLAGDTTRRSCTVIKGAQGSECVTGRRLVSPAKVCKKKKLEPCMFLAQNVDISTAEGLRLFKYHIIALNTIPAT
jgi:hypothetical protein